MVKMTDFTVQEDGFKFSNSFTFDLEFKLPLFGTIDLDDLVLGFCGGMCYGALDYFHAGLDIPAQTTIPVEGSELFTYLRNRQIHSLSIPMGVLKVFEWMWLPEKAVWQRVAWREFRKLRRRIDSGNPTVLVLIRVSDFDDPTKNHQVVARGYDYIDATKDLEIPIYDPNHKMQDTSLTMNLASPSSGINIAQSTGEELRGFYVLNYRPKTPNGMS
jgi:hypothetical protein